MKKGQIKCYMQMKEYKLTMTSLENISLSYKLSQMRCSTIPFKQIINTIAFMDIYVHIHVYIYTHMYMCI